MFKKVLIIILVVFGLQSLIIGQTTREVTVELSAQIQIDPATITLNWVRSDGATQHQVYRKLKYATTWGNIITTLPGSAIQYVDNNVIEGTSYEYRVVRTGQGFTGYGYINSGINVPFTEDRGILILLVDNNLSDSLSLEIKRLEDDLIGDGWIIKRLNIDRNESVVEVKDKIKAEYNIDVINTKAVFLLGHIPVPYSGNLNPDGHADHQGAWPADVYYADMNGNWTDSNINNSIASDERNINTPGDGKFDQTILPSDVELQIGRVDLSNMPAFALSEIGLLRKYLDKDHEYRHKKYRPEYRAVIDDSFGYFSGEAFAHSGWRNLVPLVGAENVETGDYFTSMKDKSYLWSYGCGGGSYTSAGGIGNTNNFASSDLQGVFTMLFGSYFGDWDKANNFLRAPLAQGKTLTNVWAGRPHWVLHHMGLGENIGYNVKLTQNNNSLYHSNFGARYIHIALMGDPTLRNDVVAPITDLQSSVVGNDAYLTWNASSDAVLGYNIYSKNDTLSEFIRLNQSPIKDTFYTNICLLYPGTYTYMVRAIKLETTPSGTYYNLSQGIFDSVSNESYSIVDAQADYIREGNETRFINKSTNATDYFWNFGDGNTSTDENPKHSFVTGDHQVLLIASNDCHADTTLLTISILSNTDDELGQMVIYPNPTNGKFTIIVSESGNYKVCVYNVLGTKVKEITSAAGALTIDLSTYPKGNYTIKLESIKGIKTYKLVLLE